MSISFRSWSVELSDLLSLINVTDLASVLLRRQIEHEIVALVFPSLDVGDDLLNSFCGLHGIQLADQDSLHDWLKSRDWSLRDLSLHLLRPSALTLYAQYLFGPGIEEYFLNEQGSRDSVVYSLLRVQSEGLARELWIQLAEGEKSFADVASLYSDGPESITKGVIGPVRLASIEPLLAKRLRVMRVGEITPPERMGSWSVVLRLEQISPSRLNEGTRAQLLQEQLDSWISTRVDAILAGATPDPLHFEPDA